MGPYFRRGDDRSVEGKFVTSGTSPTPASECAFSRFRELGDPSTAEAHRYPRDAVFIPSDLPEFGAIMARRIRECRPIVVIYPDGSEKMIVPRPASRTRIYWLRLLREHLFWRADRARHA